MKTTPAPPSHVRLDDQFGIEKFESFLKSNDPKESKAVFAGKSNKAVMLLHRLPTQSDSKLARLSYFLRFGSERNELRQQIKEFLKDQGIELTAEIRKALPSRFSTGSATGLIDALKKAPVEEKFVVSSFGNTLENLDWGNLKHAKSLSRENSIGMTSSARASGLNFSAQAKSIAAAVISEINTALGADKTPDEAMVEGYTALINQVQEIKINSSFSNVVQGMHKEVDRVMEEKLKNTPANKHQAIKNFGVACKKNIIPSLVLRTLGPAIINELTPERETALKADGTQTLMSKGVDVIKFNQQLQKQLNEEANSERMTDKNTREKVNFPKFSALADKYNTELSLTSAIETQIFKSS
jgi:hypothetical protein